jgi:acetyl-CoA C-acetyltransferase
VTLPTSLDPRTPVLVGAATRTQRSDDPAAASDALGLMAEAAQAAALDAGAAVELLADVDLVLVPKGIWDTQDPGHVVVDRFGGRAHSVLGEVGVLQQTLITRACQALAAGRAEVVLVMGGEDKERQRQANRAGLVRPTTLVADRAPDELWRPEGDILSRVEIERDLAVPAQSYAVIEQALAHADGCDQATRDARLGARWSSFAAVAATRPDAWDRSAPSPEEILAVSPDNRMMTTPYTRRLCSQWNVDQAAALVLTTVAEADRRSLSPSRWVFPWAAAESNATIAMPARADLHRSPAVALVGAALVDAVDHLESLDSIDLVDLYSCFPAAVGVQVRELGLEGREQLTVTGGMTFYGGPLNSYVLASTAVMVERLRAQPGATGLVTSISGMINKSGAAVWSTEPPARPFAALDVSEAARATTPICRVDPAAVGAATIVGTTVVHDRGEPWRAVTVVETADGRRTVAGSSDPDVVAAMGTGDWVGRGVDVTEPGGFVPH